PWLCLLDAAERVFAVADEGEAAREHTAIGVALQQASLLLDAAGTIAEQARDPVGETMLGAQSIVPGPDRRDRVAGGAVERADAGNELLPFRRDLVARVAETGTAFRRHRPAALEQVGDRHLKAFATIVEALRRGLDQRDGVRQ